MSSKQLLRAVIVLVVLVALWGAFAVVRRIGGDRLEELALPALTEADVDSVVMARDADTVTLAKLNGARWQVNGHAASPTAVDELFGAMTDTVRSELVAQSSTTHERMGVDSATGRHVRFFGGGRVLADLVFGAQGRQFGTVHVRRAGETEVYLLRGRLGDFVDRGVADWRERRIARVPADSATAIEVTRGGRRYTLTKVDTVWRFTAGGPADSAAVSRILQQLGEISASGFPTEAQLDSVDFTRPERRLAVLGPGDRSLLTLLFDSTSYAFWVRHDSGGPVYRMDTWTVDRLTPADSTLRPSEDAGPGG